MKGLDDHSFTILVGLFLAIPHLHTPPSLDIGKERKKRQKGLKNEAAKYDDM